MTLLSLITFVVIYVASKVLLLVKEILCWFEMKRIKKDGKKRGMTEEREWQRKWKRDRRSKHFTFMQRKRETVWAYIMFMNFIKYPHHPNEEERRHTHTHTYTCAVVIALTQRVIMTFHQPAPSSHSNDVILSLSLSLTHTYTYTHTHTHTHTPKSTSPHTHQHTLMVSKAFQVLALSLSQLSSDLHHSHAVSFDKQVISIVGASSLKGFTRSSLWLQSRTLNVASDQE